jgi:hypothetical protein
MAIKSVEVSVSRRILHIGSAAYPLTNIARVQSQVLQIKRWPPIRAFIVATLAWIALGVAATFAIKYAYSHNAGGITYDNQQRYLGFVRLGVAVLIGLSVLRLLYRLAPAWRRYYALIIETAGTAQAAIINPDRNLITSLVASITYAIENPDDPRRDFTINVTTHYNNNFGHQNVQFGAGSRMEVG